MKLREIAEKVARKAPLSKHEVEFLCRSKSDKADGLLKACEFAAAGPRDAQADLQAEIQDELARKARGRRAGINRATGRA